MADNRNPAGWQAGGRGRMKAAGNPSRAHSTVNGGGAQVYAAGRVVGRVRGNVFRKSVRGSRHMLRKPRGWASDIDSLLQAERLGARWVHITDIETGNCYRATIEQIRRYGFTFDRGHGRQIGLPLDRWTVTRPGEVQAEQLPLFGGRTP